MAHKNLIGETILGYTVVEEINTGAFGTVYKVVKTNVSGQYIRALKHIRIPTEKQYNTVLNSMGGDVSKADSYFTQMLNNIVSEIKILNELSENNVPHIVRYYENDIWTSDAPVHYDIFILMEYLTPLDEYIQNTNFYIRDVIKLAVDTLTGIQACHDNGIIHRDIKDDNIFVSEKGEYKIGDFGVSKVLKGSAKAESLKGTPDFLAPEVYLGKEGYTKSVDLYALGLVLYRLLNYGRNPFLPPFPEQYFSQDEDAAFEKRMSGKTPPIPSLGGEYIGRVVVQAISESDERFQSADEFLSALEWAVKNTPAEVLNTKLQNNTRSAAQTVGESREKAFSKTIGETVTPDTFHEEPEDDEKNSIINRCLFEPIGDTPTPDMPKAEPVMHQTGNHNADASPEQPLPNTSKRVVYFAANTPDKPDEPVVVDRKIWNNFIFIIPAVIFAIGIAIYFVMIPNIYGQVVSMIDWLFTSSENIIGTLRDPNVVLSKVHLMIGIRIFWWLWLAALICSLFFAGKQLQKKPKPDAPGASLRSKEPYFIMTDICAELKHRKQSCPNGTWDRLICLAGSLEERLSVESDFGCGSSAVIQCENEIARQLQFLMEILPKAGEAEIPSSEESLQKIKELLKKRIELKKR